MDDTAKMGGQANDIQLRDAIDEAAKDDQTIADAEQIDADRKKRHLTICETANESASSESAATQDAGLVVDEMATGTRDTSGPSEQSPDNQTKVLVGPPPLPPSPSLSPQKLLQAHEARLLEAPGALKGLISAELGIGPPPTLKFEHAGDGDKAARVSDQYADDIADMRAWLQEQRDRRSPNSDVPKIPAQAMLKAIDANRDGIKYPGDGSGVRRLIAEISAQHPERQAWFLLSGKTLTFIAGRRVRDK